MIFRLWIFALMLCFYSVIASAAQLKSVVLKQQGNQTSIYFTINGPFTHKVFSLSQPERVVLDFHETQLAVNLDQLGLTQGVVKQVRSGHLHPTTLRVVFDVNQKVILRSSPWQANRSDRGVRIDLVHSGPVVANVPITKANSIPSAASRQSTARNVSTTPRIPTQTAAWVQGAEYNSRSNSLGQKAPPQWPVKAQAQQPIKPILAHQSPVKVNNKPSKSLRDVIVVLDAGHGGKDPGARGPHKSREKDVVLAITLKLKQLIDRQPGMRAVLTRSGDYYVGLRQRLHIARKYNGDIFVAIHADAFNNPHSHGASVFALSQRGATSEAARWLAEKENYSELGGVNLGDLDDQNGVVRSVLIDLSQTATINSGLQMGEHVLNHLGGFTNLHNHKVEQARFMVLKSPDIPSILVETGFISNPVEERNLTSSAYQTRLSQAIFQGIKRYFWDSPPHGTRIEAMTTNNIHFVRNGETLPMIAARYRVSVAALQLMNNLRGISRLKPGQKLVIPSAWA